MNTSSAGWLNVLEKIDDSLQIVQHINIIKDVAIIISNPSSTTTRLYIWVENVTNGCFSIEALRLHGILYMHELHLVALYSKKEIKEKTINKKE